MKTLLANHERELMETATDSSKAAVAAKCQSCGGSGMELRGSPPQPQGGECSDCHGTGRKYPSLSRVCPGRRYIDMSGEHKISHSVPIRGRRCRCAIISNGSGRIPDVTLEKISYLPHIYRVAINLGSPGKGAPRTGDEFYCEITYMSPADPGVMKYYSGQGSTPLLGACASLVKIPEIPKPETP